MKRKLLTVLAAAILAMAPLGAAAADSTSADGHVDFTQEQIIQAGDEGTVLDGGQLQSVDPTAWNYEPPAAHSGGMITPMAASGFTGIGGFVMTVGAGGQSTNIQVPAGFLGHAISGSGTGASLGNESAAYVPTPSLTALWNLQMCNWRIDWQERNGSNILATSPGPQTSGCSTLGASVSRTSKALPARNGSQLCARLYVGGTFRGQQCHNIHA